jgi:hypothetical protein
MQTQMRSHCPRGSHNLAPRRLTGISVLLLSYAAVNIRDSNSRASFLPPGIQLRGHELPETRAFTLHLYRSRTNERLSIPWTK